MDKIMTEAPAGRRKPQGGKEKQLKKEKLARALRDNLRRRKIAASAVSDGGAGDLPE